MSAAKFETLLTYLTDLIRALPMADPVKAANQLYQAMQKLLEFHGSLHERYALLTPLQEPINKIHTLLKKQLLSLVPLMALQKKELLYFATELPMRYATLYAVLLGHSKSEMFYADREIKSKAIFYALFFCLKTQLMCYELYKELPHRFWHKVHTLYFLAEKLDCLEDIHEPFYRFETIQHLYKMILLCATSIAYQFDKEELTSLYTLIFHRAKDLSIENTLDQSVFMIQLNRDIPPFYKSFSVDDEENHAFVRGMNTQALIMGMQRLLKQRSDEISTPRGGLSKASLEKMIAYWAGDYEKNRIREKRTEQVRVCISLPVIYFFMKKPALMDDNQSALSLNQHEWSDKSAFKSVNEASDPWIKSTLPVTSESDTQNHYPFYYFDCLDKSSGGVQLKINDKRIRMLMTGAMIGIYAPDWHAEYPWRLGVVQWFKLDHHENVSCGIQFLSDTAHIIPIEIDTEDETKRLEGFLLAPLNHEGAVGDSIILPPQSTPYALEHPLIIRVEGEIREILLIEALMVNSHFSQFLYRI